MGILSNTVSICQFQVVGQLPVENLGEWAGEALAANAFQPIDQGSEELSVGWVQVDDFKDTSFASPQAFCRDHYLVFSLRRDQRRVPAALLKAHMERAEEEFLAGHPGMQQVPKQKKEELRDAVRGSLLSQTLPIPAVYDAVWDTRSGLVTFSNLSPKVVELFEAQFKQSFTDLRLVAVHPFSRAEKVLPAEIKPALEKANKSNSDTVLDLIQDNQWLGWDFLLWLMYRTMNESSQYSVDQSGPALEGESFVAYLNDRLILVGGGDSGVQKVTVAGPQDHFSEVRTALRNSKQIEEAIIYFEKQEHEWKMTLKGGMFHFASFKAPAVKLEKDNRTDQASEKEAIFYERMYVLEEGLQLFDSLYCTFLRDRLGNDWAALETQISQWLEKD